jgi:hypothetical protein
VELPLLKIDEARDAVRADDTVESFEFLLSSVDYACIPSVEQVLAPLAMELGRNYSFVMGCSNCNAHSGANALHTKVRLRRPSL